jgi:hypothetical protein
MSLPVGHVPSLGVPLLVHLLLVPAAALAVGLLGGWLVSLVMVWRFVGIGAWFNLPWGDMLAPPLAIAGPAAGRPAAGHLWLAPLIGLALLAKALAGRWGLPVLVVGLALGSLLLERAVRHHACWRSGWHHCSVSGPVALGAGGQGMVFKGGESDACALGASARLGLGRLGAPPCTPGLAADGWGLALAAAASPPWWCGASVAAVWAAERGACWQGPAVDQGLSRFIRKEGSCAGALCMPALQSDAVQGVGTGFSGGCRRRTARLRCCPSVRPWKTAPRWWW